MNSSTECSICKLLYISGSIASPALTHSFVPSVQQRNPGYGPRLRNQKLRKQKLHAWNSRWTNRGRWERLHAGHFCHNFTWPGLPRPAKTIVDGTWAAATRLCNPTASTRDSSEEEPEAGVSCNRSEPMRGPPQSWQLPSTSGPNVAGAAVHATGIM